MPLKRRTRTPPYTCEKLTTGTAPVSRADTAEEDSSEKKTEIQQRKVKTSRIVTLNVGSMAGRGQEVVDSMERAKEDQHYVRPRDKVEGHQGERAGKWLSVKMEGKMEWVLF